MSEQPLGHLIADVQTLIGFYPTGTVMPIRSIVAGHITVCLDPVPLLGRSNFHLGQCHTTTLLRCQIQLDEDVEARLRVEHVRRLAGGHPDRPAAAEAA